MKRFLRWFGAFVAVVVLAGAAALGYGYWQFTKPGPLAEDKIVLVPKGSNLTAIANALHANQVIDNRLIFRIWVRVHGAQNKLRAGEFKFPKAVSQKGATRLLVDGKMVLRRFAALEGKTTWEVLEKLKDYKGMTGEITSAPGEGLLLPDTYFFVFGETRDHMVARMTGALKKVLDDAWAKRQKGLPLKSKREALILASIIEKETTKDGERRKVASVFINRLRKGMKLQTDPTVIYGITKGKGPLGRRLLRKDLRTEHPYNTYIINGLPPGPIANPGRKAILAAVNPAQTDYYYFVADGTGGHAFARTLKEHNANVAKWRKIRRDRERSRN